MKKIFTIIGTVIFSFILTFLTAEAFSLYHFGSVPTNLTVIYLMSLFSIFEYLSLSIVYIIYKIIKKEKIKLKKAISMILAFISLILILGFIVMLNVDWLNYYSNGNSAPFYVNIIARGVEFLIPSLFLIITCVFFTEKK